jgi:hypothetical protein
MRKNEFKKKINACGVCWNFNAKESKVYAKDTKKIAHFPFAAY